MAGIIKDNEWKKVPIKEVYLGLYDGPHATPKPASNGPVFLGIKNITEDGKLELSEIRHILEEDFPKWTKRVLPRPGDIVFTYEATLNRYAIIPKGFRGCLGRRLALIRPNPQKIDTRFLFYYFFSEEWRRTVSQKTIFGSTVDRIPIISFPEFEISLPPLTTQCKIAAILSAYDDLIENNTRRIKILEEMAQALYREWFVHFRFPGHEKVQMVDSPLGRIPEGWEVATLDKVIRFQNGRAVELDDQGKFPLYGSNGVIGKTIDSRYNNGIVIGRVGAYCGSTFYCKSEFCASDNTIVAQAISEDLLCTELIYYILKNIDLGRNASGSAQPLLTQNVLKKIPVLIPDNIVNKLFKKFLNSLNDEIINLYDKINNLQLTRDCLLPKLISGEIDVSELDIDMLNEAYYG